MQQPTGGESLGRGLINAMFALACMVFLAALLLTAAACALVDVLLDPFRGLVRRPADRHGANSRAAASAHRSPTVDARP